MVINDCMHLLAQAAFVSHKLFRRATKKQRTHVPRKSPSALLTCLFTALIKRFPPSDV